MDTNFTKINSIVKLLRWLLNSVNLLRCYEISLSTIKGYCDIEWFAWETNRDHSVIFETASKDCISNSFVDHDGYSISSKGFLPAVVDIMSSELNSTIPVHFSSLIPRMLTFTLAISSLTTSNLPWFMDLTFQVLKQYCSLQHRTLLLSPVTSQLCIVFALAPSLHSFWSYFSTDLQ